MTETRTILIDLYNAEDGNWMLCDTKMLQNDIPRAILKAIKKQGNSSIEVNIIYGLTNNSFDHEVDSWEVDEAMIYDFSIDDILFSADTLTKKMQDIIIDYAIEVSYNE